MPGLVPSSKKGRPCPFAGKAAMTALLAAGDDVDCGKVEAELAESAQPERTTATRLVAGQSTTPTPYVAGQPGAAWSSEVQHAVRAKLHQTFAESSSVTSEANVTVPGERWSGLLTPAKLVRLAFHDCMPYADGTGGCDGCLMWTSVGSRFERDTLGIYSINASVTDDGNSNGLSATVGVLEAIYTNAAFPSKAQALQLAPRDMGISRADLWAFAGLVAVEYTIEENNLACAKPVMDGSSLHGQCHPRLGESDCEVAAPRPFNFETGRVDCTPEGTYVGGGDSNLSSIPAGRFSLPRPVG